MPVVSALWHVACLLGTVYMVLVLAVAPAAVAAWAMARALRRRLRTRRACRAVVTGTEAYLAGAGKRSP